MQTPFGVFFQNEALEHLERAINQAFAEDGPDLTANAVFGPADTLRAVIVTKEDALLAGLPLLSMILEHGAALEGGGGGEWTLSRHVEEGTFVPRGTAVATIEGSARLLLRCERIILNFVCHLSGIATLTRRYVKALSGTGVTLLDTRKTLPGLRYPEKYAVLVGGGRNHRKNLSEILMLKDNHIDAAGGITPAVARLRAIGSSIPPIEVECRTQAEVLEAVSCRVERIMLDNMDAPAMDAALAVIPRTIEVEVSGGISLDTLGVLARLTGERKPNFVSVGRITHSAPYADLSMLITG